MALKNATSKATESKATDTSVSRAEFDEVKAMLSALTSNLTPLIAKLSEQTQERPAVAVVSDQGTTRLHSNPTDAEVKAYAKSKGQNVMGKVTPNRMAQWRALWDADHAVAVDKVETRSRSNGGSRFGNVSSNGNRRNSERTAIPSRKDARDMFIRHPEKDEAESFTDDEWADVSKMTGRNGNGNPANLTGNDRRVAYKLSTGQRTDNLMLVGCEIVAKLRAAGLVG